MIVETLYFDTLRHIGMKKENLNFLKKNKNKIGMKSSYINNRYIDSRTKIFKKH